VGVRDETMPGMKFLHNHPWRIPTRVGSLGASLLCWLLLSMAGVAASPTPRPAAPTQMAPMLSALTPPPTVNPPRQADNGAQLYFYICMTCHGDKGQGLTQAWRDLLGPPDDNCWASKCHSPNKLTGSFTFPREVPAVIGPGILQSFGTASGLHDFIKSRMPYQAPGSLSDDQYWELTAFLMRENGYDLGRKKLDASVAKQIDFARPPLPAANLSSTLLTAFGGGAVLVILILIVWFWRARGESKSHPKG
jgi:S-disulfanyl-L-cysteine oxidoreductase SoxD